MEVWQRCQEQREGKVTEDRKESGGVHQKGESEGKEDYV